jgi:DNA transposition AAA+ family ATPase
MVADVAHIEDRVETITEKKRVENARSWIEGWIKENRLTYTAAARQIGLGDAARTPVARFVERRHEGDPTRLVLAIEQFRATIEGPEGVSEIIGFRETRCARLIWSAAHDARDNHKMAAVIGYTGCGKTEALKQFQRRTYRDNKPPVRVVTANVLINAPFLARKLALEMGLVERGGEPAMCLELVNRRLRAHPEFWIVDEANFLKESCLHVLRNIHDVTGTGILLAGTPSFIALVANRSGGTTARDDDREIERGPDGPLALFADRIFSTVLPGITEDEITEIAESVLNCELTDAALAKLVIVVNRNMRLLTRMMLQLREFRRRAGTRKVDDKMIDAAWIKLTHVGP